ncbi:MAG: cryptochrome/photolyase family protein [Gammaproteobacteria bacterium]|nr:cryptochrome/photolyase family protein [Gammaproteobacteria bacterium]
MAKTLRLILGDQLNASHSWFKQKQHDVVYLIAELRQETDYVPHHGQKIYAFFMAMQQFAQALQQAGHKVQYLMLDETNEYESLPELITKKCEELDITAFEYQQPDEWRLHQQLNQLSETASFNCRCVESEHFLLPFANLDKYFKTGTRHRMESFYRKMRKETGYLMQFDKPEGGKWNYDANNREAFNQQAIDELPEIFDIENRDKAIFDRIVKQKIKSIGTLPESINWPVNRTQSRQLLHFFCREQLNRFGSYQDAMTCQADDKWGLYHSRLSFAMNSKMLSPKEVIEVALDYYHNDDFDIDLAQIEGFIRQILGWREFVRGIYWLNVADYGQLNYLHHTTQLPKYFWTGQTKMRCMSHCLTQSLDNAYAHHIQRLMVIGNFCLLTGIHPDDVDLWYLSVYVDAIEWVEQPNTRGMSQFADGGLIASKPYISSGQYINKMSDYCQHCHYKVKQKTGNLACPFNSLYWHFLYRHKDKFENNPRLGFTYNTWHKMNPEQQQVVLEQADSYLEQLDDL